MSITKWSLLFIIILCIGCASQQKKNDNPVSSDSDPKLLKPIVKKIWINPEIRNNGSEWIEGHYLYRIERETTWSK